MSFITELKRRNVIRMAKSGLTVFRTVRTVSR